MPGRGRAYRGRLARGACYREPEQIAFALALLCEPLRLVNAAVVAAVEPIGARNRVALHGAVKAGPCPR